MSAARPPEGARTEAVGRRVASCVASPPVSSLARGLRLGRAAVEVGAIGALERLAPGGGGEPAGTRQTQALMRALLDLRGAALKIAQFLSLEDGVLPEPIRRELSRACHRVPPMGPAFARSRIRAELGPLDACFVHFDDKPFAAASLGQVHAATTLDGLEVAVKVQYPCMRETVRADMQLLHRVAGVLGRRAIFRSLLAEAEQRLLEECDYCQEADALAWFRDRLAVPDVRVAEVVPRLSSTHVLCTVRLPGRHLDEWLSTDPPQDARDAAAQRLYDVFVQSLHVHGRLHADPHPGNVLFGNDGSIGLLDFGCTRWISAECRELVARIWRVSLSGDEADAKAVFRDMGLFAHRAVDDDVTDLERDLHRRFLAWVATPFREEHFDFGRRAGFADEGRRLLGGLFGDDTLAGIRPEFHLVNRTLYGLYRLFERLRARVACQTAWTSS